MRKNKWIVTAKRADFNRISQECGISPILARLIRNRDVIGTDGTMRFLKGGLKDLYDPRLLPDAEKAAEILARKIREGKRIRIIGDYDVDGICSSYILWYSLCQFGGHADAVLPERLTDGYGINERLVRDAADHGVDTILTCDNGIAASDPLRTAGELGMTVIVTDHHEVPFKVRPDGTRSWIIPPAQAVVDPKIPTEVTGAEPYPFPDICGAVVAYLWRDIRTGIPRAGKISSSLCRPRDGMRRHAPSRREQDPCPRRTRRGCCFPESGTAGAAAGDGTCGDQTQLLPCGIYDWSLSQCHRKTGQRAQRTGTVHGKGRRVRAADRSAAQRPQ